MKNQKKSLIIGIWILFLLFGVQHAFAATCGQNVKYTISGNTISFLKDDPSKDAVWDTDCRDVFRDDQNITIVKILDKIGLSSGYEAFKNAKYVREMDLTYLDVSGVSDLKSMFAGCTSLINLNVSNWDISDARETAFMFYQCSSLKELDVSRWNTSNLRNTQGMFNECFSLTDLDVSNWITSKITNMAQMFSVCRSLTTVDVSRWDTSEVTNMDSMFLGCTSLITVNVTNWDISKVTTLYKMFLNCSSLKGLDVGRWNTSQVGTMESLFENCNSLENLDVRQWNTSSVQLAGYLFARCSSLKNLDVSNWDTTKVKNMHGLFYDCSSLTSINVERWKTSNVSDMDFMFSGCSSLTELDLGKWDITNITTVDHIFADCNSLTSLDLRGWDTSNIKQDWRLDNIFKDDNKLNTLTLGKNTVKTNIFTSIPAYNSVWYYSGAIDDATNPLPLKTEKKEGSLFTSYNFNTMAGTWSVDQEYIAPEEPEISMALYRANNFRDSGKIISLEYNDGNLIPADIYSSDEFTLLVTAKNTTNKELREIVTLPDGLSFSKETYEKSKSISLGSSTGTFNLPVYSVYHIQSIDSLTIKAGGDKEAELSIAVEQGKGIIKVNFSLTNLPNPHAFGINDTGFKWNEVPNGGYSDTEAVMAMELAGAAYSDQNVLESLHNLGFTKIEHFVSVSEQFETNPFDCVHFIAQKKIPFGSEIKTVITVVISGTRGKGQWIGNFLSAIAVDDAPSTFLTSAIYIYEHIEKYVNRNYISASDVILFVCGHSRGAATAGIVGHKINTDPKWHQSVTYTFAAPNNIRTKLSKTGEKNIFNYIDAHDIIVYVPQGFEKYGNTYVINTAEAVPVPVYQYHLHFTDWHGNIPDNSVLVELIIKITQILNESIVNEETQGKDLVFPVTPVVPMYNPNINIVKSWNQVIDAIKENLYEVFAYHHASENYLAWLYGNGIENAVKYKDNSNMTDTENSAIFNKIIRSLPSLDLSKDSDINQMIMLYKILLAASLKNQGIIYSKIGCPVDVKLYAPDGTVVASIVDHQTEFVNESDDYFAFSDGENDYVFYLENAGYYLKIIGNDEGKMNVENFRIIDGIDVPNSVSFVDVPISNNEIFSLNISNENFENSTLTSDGIVDPGSATKVIIIDKDSLTKTIDLGTSGEIWEKLTYQLGAVVRPSDTVQTVTWKSSDPSIAVIDDSGLVTGMKNGTVTITATAQDGSNASTDVMLQVITNVDQNNILVKSIAPIGIGFSKQLEAQVDQNVKPENDNLVWTSKTPDIVSVTSDGKVTGIKAGYGVLAICPATGEHYCKSIDIEITDAISSLDALNGEGVIITGDLIETENSFYQLHGLPEPLSASHQFLWSSSDTNIATVDETGFVNFVKNGTVTITVSATDGSNKTASVTLTYDGPIASAPTEISIVPAGPITLQTGKTYQLSVSVLPEGAAKDVVWTSSDESRVTVDASGLLTGISKGSNIIITAVSASDPNVIARIIVNVTDQVEPSHQTMNFWRFDIVGHPLPRTGFSAARPQALPEKPLDLKYQPLRLTLEIPSVSAAAELVEVPYMDGEYPITWLGSEVGLLEGFALPGEGYTVLTGHNHLNTNEYGPFALLSSVKEGDRIFIRDARDRMKTYVVYANEKVNEMDHAAVEAIAVKYDNSLTMITCEDERVEGGYANRRIVAARPY